jgi:hypothetical protein
MLDDSLCFAFRSLSEAIRGSVGSVSVFVFFSSVYFSSRLDFSKTAVFRSFLGFSTDSVITVLIREVFSLSLIPETMGVIPAQTNRMKKVKAVNFYTAI